VWPSVEAGKEAAEGVKVQSRCKLALGSLDTFASRPNWVADSSVSPNNTAAAAYCHRNVGLGFATIDGIT